MNSRRWHWELWCHKQRWTEIAVWITSGSGKNNTSSFEKGWGREEFPWCIGGICGIFQNGHQTWTRKFKIGGWDRNKRETKRYEQPLHLQVDKTHSFNQFLTEDLRWGQTLWEYWSMAVSWNAWFKKIKNVTVAQKTRSNYVVWGWNWLSNGLDV